LVLGTRARLNATGSEIHIAAKFPKTVPTLGDGVEIPAGGMNHSFNRGGLMSLFDLVFGCWHKRCSFPITVRGKLRRSTAAASVTGTYVVCLDCGREFAYDWSQMKMLEPKPRTARAAEPVTVVSGLKAA
jgi:hypothetical protein